MKSTSRSRSFFLRTFVIGMNFCCGLPVQHRTASDLEEKGLISNIEKGVIKDLIISGDAKFLAAMEKYEKGDRSDLATLCRSLMARKGTVDLLENMDLDFVFEDKVNMDTFGFTSVGMPPTSANKNVTGIATRRPSIDHHVRSNSIFGIADGDAPLTSFNSSVFDDNQHQVELSAYEALAKSLSATKQSGKGAKDRNNGRSTQARPPSRGLTALDERQKSTYMNTRLASSPSNSPSHNVTRQQTRQNTAAPSSSFSASTPASETRISSQLTPDSVVPVSANDAASASHVREGEVIASQAHGEATVNQQVNGTPSSQQGLATTSGVITSNGSNYAVTTITSASSTPRLPENSSGASAPASDGQQPAGSISAIAPSGQAVGSSAETINSDLNSKDFVSMTIAGGPLWAKSVDGQRHFIGAYSPEQRRKRIERFIEKRNRRVWTKKVKYDVRKNFADSRLRVKGRFVKKEDEEIMRELMTI